MAHNAVIGTGLDGLVGSRFVELYGETYDITNLSLATGIDITNSNEVMEAIGGSSAPVIIHLAAFTDTKAAAEQEGDTNGACYRVNVAGTQAVVDAAKATGKHLIHISTDYVFDGMKGTPYTEEDTPKPIEWYGQTKFLAEQVVLNSKIPATIIRISFPYRASYEAKADLLAKTLVGIRDRTLHPQFNDTLITPTFIDDIAHVLDLMVEKLPTGIYHAVGGTSVSNFDFAQAVAEAFHEDATVVKQGSLTEYLATTDRIFHRYLALSNAKLTRELEYHMATLEEGLASIAVQNEEDHL